MSKNYLLAINNVGGACNVATSVDTTILSQKKIEAERGHSEIILPLIRSVLREAELDINDLTGFLVCTGPGNYTSLRVAISTVRGLALASGNLAYGISLFELLATEDGELLVLVRGPADKLYVQKFSNGLKIDPPRLLSLNEIRNRKEYSKCNTIGYRATEIGKMINSKSSADTSLISFDKFIKIGHNKLKKPCPKPAPLYIK